MLDYTQSSVVYHGNGFTTAFPIPFKVWNTQQLAVVLRTPEGKQETATGWKVELTETGGMLTYDLYGEPLPEGWKLAISRKMPFTQEVNLITGTRFDPQAIETALDMACAERQELLGRMERTLSVPVTSEQTGEEYLNEFEGKVQNAADSAEEANDYALQAKEYLERLMSVIPVPREEDAGKNLYVGMVEGIAKYVLMSGGGGGGGTGGTGYADYQIDAREASGEIVVKLKAIGHPDMPAIFNPIVNLITQSNYSYVIKSRSKEDFTIQLFKPDGTPGVTFATHKCFGDGVEFGDGSVFGEEGKGSDVTIALTIPLPPVKETDDEGDEETPPAPEA